MSSKPVKQVILSNFKSTKTEHPSAVKIDTETGKSVQITQKNPSRILSLSTLQEKLQQTFLPADYPHSVTKEYLPFTIYGVVSSVSFTAMMFMSTQALFVALGGTTT